MYIIRKALERHWLEEEAAEEQDTQRPAIEAKDPRILNLEGTITRVAAEIVSNDADQAEFFLQHTLEQVVNKKIGLYI